MNPEAASSTTEPLSAAEERKQMGRRALIAAAGLGIVGVAAAEAPNILGAAGHLTQQEIDNAIAAGRKALAQELTNLEDVGIDVAVDVANVTHFAVSLFVLPIVDVLAGIGVITLDVASVAVEKAQGFTQLLGIDIQALKTLDGILKGWKTNVAAFPVAVKSLNDVDTAAADKYLTALKAKLNAEANK
jgi:hypothetical protein